MGIVDTRSGKAIEPENLKNVLQQQLPCLLNNPK
jgi:hypothetical protein